MSFFDISDCKIKGLKIVTPFLAEDERGYFLKDFEKDIYKELGLDNDLNECFVTHSKKDVIRGMHFQTNNPQTKLVLVLQGEILDVAVDLRKGSTTFGKWEAVTLSEANHKVFYIPSGFAHGFQVISDTALVSYKCFGKYDPETDTGIVYNDIDLSVDWIETKRENIVSEKDRKLMKFREFKRKYKFL